MLKVVPDPPRNSHSLEDTLIQATVVHQAFGIGSGADAHRASDFALRLD
ncbi:hypothetical protein LVV80_02200 [Pseudomonas sp. KCA11]|nr:MULTISPECIES: hypothetical protein [unclassified Pseudomonas]MCE5990834.1 hypothetical protein [Pseudomonas sp. KCA11]UMY64310.1 hypothetical protein MKK04_18010 [Pseudomonas sp. LS.1a]